MEEEKEIKYLSCRIALLEVWQDYSWYTKFRWGSFKNFSDASWEGFNGFDEPFPEESEVEDLK